MEKKYWLAGYLCTVVAGLQISAWYLGKDGAVFALTSLVIGGIAGSMFGFTTAQRRLKNETWKTTVETKGESD